MESQCEYRVSLSGQLFRSVTGAAIDDRGHLILTMSDGQTLDVGQVRGDADPETLQQLADGVAYALEVAQGALPLSGGSLTGNLQLPNLGGIRLGDGSCSILGYGQELLIQAGNGAVGLFLRRNASTGKWSVDVTGDRIILDEGTLAGLREPEEPDEAANKEYVDRLLGETADILHDLADYAEEVCQ